MKILPIVIAAVLLASIFSGCSNAPTSPKLATIAVYVNAGADFPVKGISVDILQTNQTKVTDSAGIAAFEVNPGTYTVRVRGVQGGGPVLHDIDSTLSVGAGQADTLRVFDCLMCL